MTDEQIKEALYRFQSLPDDCAVRDPVAAVLLSVSVWTLRRNDPVPRIQISERCYGRRVGDIRRKLRGGEAAA